MKYAVMLSFSLLVAFGAASEATAQSCPEWTFETNTETLGGTYVSVFDIPGYGTFVDLDESSTVDVPGAVLQLAASPYTLSSSSLPDSISINSMQVNKSIDDPGTPSINEGDFWFVLSSSGFVVSYLNESYFEATVSGEALRITSTGYVYEDFVLTIKGFLPDENGEEVLSYCSNDDPIRKACEEACWEVYKDEDIACNTAPNPPACSRVAFLKAVACVVSCRFI